MADTTTSSASHHIDTSADGASIISQILSEGAMVRGDNPAQTKHARDIIGEFVQQVLDEHTADNKRKVVDQGAVAAIQDRIAEIDELIAKQLDAILHAPAFQSLEARWRGLHHLVMNSETGTRLKIRVMNASKAEMRKDFEAAPDFDRSTLFKKIYEEEYGTFGGAPYGLLIGDYEFDGSSPDVALLTEFSKVAAAAHAPFITAASPHLFDMDNFSQLGTPGDLAKLFESTQLTKWREFRESEDSRYVGLVLPHVLLRLPYGAKGIPVDGFVYEENVGADDKNFLWGNAAYALGERINAAFSKYSWCAAIRGVEGGGLVENLPVHVFKTADGDLAIKTPTEVSVTDRRENELSELGFIGLCYRKNSGQAAFFGGSTANKPKVYNLPSATANARLSAQLPYILATSRFAHYIKVMMRDKIGSFMTKDNVSTYLNNWIAEYILLNDDAGQETKARLPLREARIDVTDVPGKPGAYRAVVFLKPHFQLNELTVSMRLVADLPPPAA
jgi:type VI secretion system protein ImpC